MARLIYDPSTARTPSRRVRVWKRNRFRPIQTPATYEDLVLEVLIKQHPPQKSASVVDLCSKVVWCIDPRYSTYLDQFGKVKQLMQTYHPSEKEKMIMQNWKSSESLALKQLMVVEKRVTHSANFLSNTLHEINVQLWKIFRECKIMKILR